MGRRIARHIPVGVRRAVGFALLVVVGVEAPDRFGLLFVVLLFLAAGMWVLATRRPVPAWERVLSAISIGAVGWFALDVQEPGRELRAGDGEVGAIAKGVDVKPDRGLAVAAAIKFNGCSKPATVRLVVGGTAEFFADNAERLARPVRVRVAIPGDRISASEGVPLELFSADSEDDLAVPLPVQASRDRDRYRHVATRRADGVIVLEGDVLRWRDHLSPLATEFRAEWLHPRDRLGTTCYLHVPSLTGDLTAYLGADLADAEVKGWPRTGFYDYDEARDVSIPYRAELELTTGTLQVHSGEGSVIDELSRPAPDQTLDGDAAYACATDPARTAPVGDRAARRADHVQRDRPTALEGPRGAYGKEYLEGEFDDCGGRLVMAGAEADFARDLVLILLGALVSLAAEAYFRASEVRREA